MIQKPFRAHLCNWRALRAIRDSDKESDKTFTHPRKGVCKVFVPKVCHYRKRIAEPLLQRSNMSIEKGLSTSCTPAECYVHKQTRRDIAP